MMDERQEGVMPKACEETAEGDHILDFRKVRLPIWDRSSLCCAILI